MWPCKSLTVRRRDLETDCREPHGNAELDPPAMQPLLGDAGTCLLRPALIQEPVSQHPGMMHQQATVGATAEMFDLVGVPLTKLPVEASHLGFGDRTCQGAPFALVGVAPRGQMGQLATLG